jgi:molybdopterin converting factor small subunit
MKQYFYFLKKPKFFADFNPKSEEEDAPKTFKEFYKTLDETKKKSFSKYFKWKNGFYNQKNVD